MTMIRTCSIDGCERTVLARGWCEMHYRRAYRTGTPHRPPIAPKPTGPLLHRTIRPLMECGYSSDERSVIARMACYRSAEDAEKASAALLLRFEKLDALAANYSVSDGPEAA